MLVYLVILSFSCSQLALGQPQEVEHPTNIILNPSDFEVPQAATSTPYKTKSIDEGVLEDLKKEVFNLLTHLEDKVQEAISTVNRTSSTSKFYELSKKLQEEALDGIRKEFRLVYAEIERLKAECKFFPHMLICLVKHEKDFENYVRFTEEAVKDFVEGEVATFETLVAENWHKFDVDGVLKRIKDLVKEIHDMNSLFAAVRVIIENLDLPTKIIKSLGGFIVDSTEEFVNSLKHDVVKMVADVSAQTHGFAAKLKQCLKA